MAPHECRQEKRLEDVESATVRHQKEFYEGREGRQPMTVRLDRCERIVNALTYVSTALLISTLIGAGTVLWNTVVRTARPQTDEVHQYEPGTSKN